MNEGAGSYTIGYYPSQHEEGGRFRRLQVKVTCSGCTVRHREGYFGAERQGSNRAAQRETMSAAVTLRESKGRWHGRLDVVMLFLDAAGESKGGGEEPVVLDLGAADREPAMTSGFNYRQTLPMVADARRLVIAVRDVPTGRIGTVRVNLEDMKSPAE